MRVIHITDLHLTKSTPAERISGAIEAINALKPDVVICTGDICTRAPLGDMVEAYVRATNFRSSISCQTFLTVPGNHDLADKDFNEIDLYYKLWSEDETFVQNLGGAFAVGVNSGRQTDAADVANIPDERARKAFESAAAHIRRGDVVPSQVQFIQDVIASADLDDVRILALHHHLMPIYNPVYKTAYNFDIVTNAADILEALRRHRFDLVLNGHKHSTQLNILNGVLHLTGGAMFLDLPNGEENSFNVIDLGEMIHIRVCHLQSKVLETLWCGPNPKYFYKA